MWILFIPFSFVYFLIISIRNILYNLNIFKKYNLNTVGDGRDRPLRIKVISVGNITWGGTGKTPVVAFIADLLSKKNHRVAILIRGYGNDESELLPKLTKSVPILIGRDRVKTGKKAIEEHLVDTILLDDGFQYRRVERDLDIVCIDATNPLGNGWLIPSGSMRETIGSLKRAGIFLITKADLVSNKDKLEKLEKRLKSINPGAVIARAIHRPLYFYRLLDKVGDGRDRPLLNEEKVNIGQVNNKDIALVSAIGSPACFEKTILRLGLKINKHFIFRDHHCYAKNDIAQIQDYCKKNKLETIVTTEKDAVKLKSCQLSAVSCQLLVLKVRLEIIENEDGFYNRLFGIYNS